jgi:hypothetical protein
MLLPYRPPWRLRGQGSLRKNRRFSALNYQLAKLASLVPRVAQKAGEQLLVACKRLTL